MLQYKYCDGGTLSSAILKQGCTYTWRAIMAVRQSFENLTRLILGDGESGFITSNWLHIGALNQFIPLSIWKNLPYKNLSVRESLSMDDLFYTHLVETLLPDVIQTIVDFFFLLRPGVPDRFGWILESSGIFSTKSAFSFIRQKVQSYAIYKSLWVSPIPLKTSFLSLRALHNRLPCDDNIQQLHIYLASRCVCCPAPSTENVNHLFMQSEWAGNIWSYFESAVQIRADRSSVENCARSWFVDRPSSPMGTLQRLLFVLILEEIWRARNAARNDDASFYLPASILRICKTCKILMSTVTIKPTVLNHAHLPILNRFGYKPLVGEGTADQFSSLVFTAT